MTPAAWAFPLGFLAVAAVVMLASRWLFERMRGPAGANEIRYAGVAIYAGSIAIFWGVSTIALGLLGLMRAEDPLIWIFDVAFVCLGAFWIWEAARWRVVVHDHGLDIRTVWSSRTVTWSQVKQIRVPRLTRALTIILDDGSRVIAPFGVENFGDLPAASRAHGVDIRGT